MYSANSQDSYLSNKTFPTSSAVEFTFYAPVHMLLALISIFGERSASTVIVYVASLVSSISNSKQFQFSFYCRFLFY